MEYLYLGPLLIVIYMVAVDRNLGEYLYLKLLDEPVLLVRTTVIKYRLLLSLRYDRFLMKRGIMPQRFYDMAEQIRDSTPADPK
jgi:hypothetical protein